MCSQRKNTALALLHWRNVSGSSALEKCITYTQGAENGIGGRIAETYGDPSLKGAFDPQVMSLGNAACFHIARFWPASAVNKRTCRAHFHSSTHTHTNTKTHKHTNTQIHKYTHTHTHTHIHTHTQVFGHVETLDYKLVACPTAIRKEFADEEMKVNVACDVKTYYRLKRSFI